MLNHQVTQKAREKHNIYEIFDLKKFNVLRFVATMKLKLIQLLQSRRYKALTDAHLGIIGDGCVITRSDESLPARSLHHRVLLPYLKLFRPDNPFINLVDALQVLIYIFLFLYSPLQINFGNVIKSVAMDTVFILVICLNVLIKFNTSIYSPDNTLITDRALLVKTYLKKKFAYQVICIVALASDCAPLYFVLFLNFFVINS